jgi:hypothetical protein
LRGDKVILEITRKEYLSITFIEVYTASLSGGSMTKGVTRNVRYDKFNNFCTNDKGKDLKGTAMTGAKYQSLNVCLAECARNAEKCSGVEWYNNKWNGVDDAPASLVELTDEMDVYDDDEEDDGPTSFAELETQGINDESAQCYLNRYPDLQRAFGKTNVGKAKQHYNQHGRREKRNPNCDAADKMTNMEA